jgi:hypothetical protein
VYNGLLNRSVSLGHWRSEIVARSRPWPRIGGKKNSSQRYSTESYQRCASSRLGELDHRPEPRRPIALDPIHVAADDVPATELLHDRHNSTLVLLHFPGSVTSRLSNRQ